MKPDIEKVRQIAVNNPEARAILEHMKGRERSRSLLSVDRIVRVLRKSGVHVTTTGIRNAMREYEAAGVGHIHLVRGKVVRLEWDVDAIQLSKRILSEDLSKITKEDLKEQTLNGKVGLKIIGGRIHIDGKGIHADLPETSNSDTISNVIKLIKDLN